MEPNNTIKKESPLSSCSFCNPSTQEIKTILKSAFKKLKTLSKKTKGKLKGQDLDRKGEDSCSLQRLIKMLFEKQQF